MWVMNMSKLDQLTKELHELERKLRETERERNKLLQEKARFEEAIEKEKLK